MNIINLHFNRRTLLKRSALFAVPTIIPAAFVRSVSASSNSRLRVGVIGVGIRGKYLIANLPETAQVVAMADSYLPRMSEALHPTGVFEKPLAKFAQTDGKKCKQYQDYRKLLAQEELDAVIIATPDHHHVLAAMLACQRDLDVYLEKPLSLTIAEGRALASAVSKTKRILQVGSQQRTMAHNVFACEWIREGGLGKISHVELPNFPGPMQVENIPAEKITTGLDWDLCLGPTPMLPHSEKLWRKEEFKVGKLLWRGWDLYNNFSGHLMTNWGAHSVDMVQYALGMDDSGPVEISPNVSDLNDSLDDHWSAKSPLIGTLKDREQDRMRFCPVKMKYANGIELHFTPKVNEIIFHGSKGTCSMRRNHFKVSPSNLVSNPPSKASQTLWNGSGHVARPHLQNWLDCIETRKTPNAPVEVGHRTITVCHLANLSRQLNRTLRWNPETEKFLNVDSTNDDSANGFLDRPRRKGFELPII